MMLLVIFVHIDASMLLCETETSQIPIYRGQEPGKHRKPAISAKRKCTL